MGIVLFAEADRKFGRHVSAQFDHFIDSRHATHRLYTRLVRGRRHLVLQFARLRE
jgi:hypothetical protein